MGSSLLHLPDLTLISQSLHRTLPGVHFVLVGMLIIPVLCDGLGPGTMQEVVDRLADEYDWSDSVSNLSAKLQRESIRYKEVVELADVLDCDIVWVKRGARR